MKRGARGFTVAESLIALLLVCVVFIGGYLALGLAMVDGGDAVKAAEGVGYTDARVITRHNAFPQDHGCAATDDLAFDVKAKDSSGKDVALTVCCGSWYKGCAVKH